MAISAVKAMPVSLLFNTSRDMMTFPAPTKKPICAEYQRGECRVKSCPKFHPKNLVVDKAGSVAPPNSTPASTKPPVKSTTNPTKPPTERESKPFTPTSSQLPKNDSKSVPTTVVPQRQVQKPSPGASRPAELQSPKDPILPTNAPQQSRPPSHLPGPHPKAQGSNSNRSPPLRVGNSKGNPKTVATPPQTVISCSVAISAVTRENSEQATTKETPPSPSTSGTSLSQGNKSRRKKKVKSENPKAEPSPPPANGSLEKGPTSEPSPVQCEQANSGSEADALAGLQEDFTPSNREVCRKYLHKRCSNNPCIHYHVPALADLPPLCWELYEGPCLRRFCDFYHPEGNRHRMICRKALKFQCDRQNCRWFHFNFNPTDGEEVVPAKPEPPTPAIGGGANRQSAQPQANQPVPSTMSGANRQPIQPQAKQPLPSTMSGANRQPIPPQASQPVPSMMSGANRQPVHPQANQPLPSTMSTHGADVDPRQLQCPAWNDGYCPRGRQCNMQHLHRDLRWRMEAEQAAAKTMDRTIFDTTKVVFGAGCEIKEVTTALESCRVLISNLPAGTTKEALEEILTRAGFNREAFHIMILRSSVDRETQEASVMFHDTRHAKTVVQVLDKQEYFGEVLKFELAPVVTGGGMDDWTYNRSSYLEVTFNAPSKNVQAIYPSVQHAIQKAKALNGRRCGGRTVYVTVAHVPRKDETWTYIKNSIIISNVPINTPDSVIHHFANPFSIGTFGLRKFKVDTVLQKLEEHMHTVGGLKPGDFDATQDYRDGTVFVRGRFDTWERADKVYQSLQGTELDFLVPTHAKFFLAFPHQYSLHVPLQHYDAQKEIYDSLESRYGRDPDAHVVATRYRAVCLIQVVGVNRKAVGALKLKVEGIARGEIVEVWDKFFLNWQGEAFFGRLLRQFKAYVRPDRTRQVLRVYGSEVAVDRARREIREQMKTLAALDYQMTIERRCIGFFIHKGMKILGDMLGEDNVWLHTTSKPYFVSVRGGHDAEHALQKLVSEALKKPLQPPVRDWSKTCPLCFEEPTQPFPLACRHVYCTGCLKHMLISATDGKSIPICCIGDEGRCKIPVPLPVIERFISPARLTQMFENSFRTYLEQRPNEFRFCPTPDCTQIYRVSKEDSAVIQCPACLIDTCSHCHKSPHSKLTCEENALVGSKSGQERLLERWAKGNSNVKKCPDCGILIEKIEGCNHIHCRCGAHVCWICVRTFNDGIYDHLSAVHGGAYDPDP